MRSLWTSRWIAALFGVALVLAQSSAWAESAADIAAARELFVEGSSLSREGKWGEARERFERSLALKRAAITLYSLGVAQKETGQLVEALESFRAFLLEPSEPATKPFEAPARRAVGELEQRVAELSLTIEPPDVDGLRVSIDSEEIPLAALAAARLLNPGAHHVVAEAPGYQSANTRVTLEEGSAVSIQLRLVPEEIGQSGDVLPPPPPSYAIDPPPQAPLPVRDTRRWLSYALLGGGTASLTAGVALGLVSISQSTYASDRRGLEQASAENKAMAADLFGAAGIVGISVGLVLLISSKPRRTAVVDANGAGFRF